LVAELYAELTKLRKELSTLRAKEAMFDRAVGRGVGTVQLPYK